MYRVTTPTHTFSLPMATSECEVIQVTYKQQDEVVLSKQYDDGVLPSGMTLDGNDVILNLTQAETKKFVKGKAKVQVRALTGEGKALASDNFEFQVYDVNNEDILT